MLRAHPILLITRNGNDRIGLHSVGAVTIIYHMTCVAPETVSDGGIWSGRGIGNEKREILE